MSVCDLPHSNICFLQYINRLRGYHSDLNKMEGYEMGIIDSYYYALPAHKTKMRDYWPIKQAFYSREYPTSWRNIDHDIIASRGQSFPWTKYEYLGCKLLNLAPTGAVHHHCGCCHRSGIRRSRPRFRLTKSVAQVWKTNGCSTSGFGRPCSAEVYSYQLSLPFCSRQSVRSGSYVELSPKTNCAAKLRIL